MNARTPRPPVTDRWLVVQPHDTVQVRDGRSFDAGTGGIAHSVRPWPSTIAGALTAALGGEDLQSVRGPVLVRETGDGWRPYFPAPKDLHTDPARNDVWRMCLEGGPVAEPGARSDGGAPASATDLHCTEEDGTGGLRLLTLPSGAEGKERTEPCDALLPGRTLHDYLHGDLVVSGGVAPYEELDAVDDPVVPEPRTGIGLDPRTRTVRNGMLYRTTHMRLEQGWAFAAHVTPKPEQQRQVDIGPPDPVQFGGLARMADVDPAPGTDWPRAPARFPGGRVLLYVATPALWPRGWRPDTPPGAELVSAVVGDPLAVASASPKHNGEDFWSKRVLAWAVPPGSIYLLRFPGEEEAAVWAAEHHARALGPPARERMDTAGFGVVLTGVWS
ncbi:type III-B CRISPR module-associated protein Cmr3 [Nocardiopsis chromatogenes]|uniref:type III-B CRISPR module-associated protein Cmr3 n=1 Tax=Nocardiopsis chromatogenes TaxID=280239 RepID=UPI001EF9CE6A|nr:type III-B CRISPR module-associated protein Cmr3 [Nocardiopsis chromatogenes]